MGGARALGLAAVASLVACPGCDGSDDRAASAQRAQPPKVRGPAVVWAVGDGADGSNEARALARRIERDDPDAFLYLGDVYPSGSAEDFADRYDTVYGGLAKITWPTMGNHEYQNRATGYYPYWGRRGRARPWYRIRLAGWDIFALNSETPHEQGSRQVRWLQRALDGAKGTCRLAFWHRPRFSAGSVHGDSPDTEPLWNALRGHARLILGGHDHLMLRFRRHDGMTQYVAGSGGDTLYGAVPDDRVVFARAGTQGALRMRLARGRARLEFRTIEGRVLDRSDVRCRPA